MILKYAHCTLYTTDLTVCCHLSSHYLIRNVRKKYCLILQTPSRLLYNVMYVPHPRLPVSTLIVFFNEEILRLIIYDRRC